MLVNCCRKKGDFQFKKRKSPKYLTGFKDMPARTYHKQRRHDLTGQRFGELVAYAPGDNTQADTKASFWICKCDCGNWKKVTTSALRKGQTQSCGCWLPKINAPTKQEIKEAKQWKKQHEKDLSE
jgi:hypothetical protein